MVYKLSFPDGMEYVGKAEDFKRRMRFHRGGYGGAVKVTEWLASYGWNAVRVQVIKEAPPSELSEWEIRLISEHCTLWPCGLNLTRGGDGADSETVRESWRNPTTRERHEESMRNAWKDDAKRARIIAGLAQSETFQSEWARERRTGAEANAKRSATWEAKREARLADMPPKQAAKERERLRKNREKTLKCKHAKRTQASSAKTGARASDACGYETGSEA